MFSQVEVQPSRGRLIVDCKDAPDAAADLRDPGCLAAVLGHLEREFGIDSVILSHYVERQYGPAARNLSPSRRNVTVGPAGGTVWQGVVPGRLGAGSSSSYGTWSRGSLAACR